MGTNIIALCVVLCVLAAQNEATTFVPISVARLNHGSRKGPAPKTQSCLTVKTIPRSMHAEYRFPNHDLIKYTEAFGIPVVSKKNVLDEALIRACYVTAFMFADRSSARNKYYEGRGFVHVMGYKDTPGRPATKCMMSGWWKGYNNCRALPPTDEHPYIVISEENVLCAHLWGMKDRFGNEDLLVHELAHTITRFMMKENRSFRKEVYYALKNATEKELWKDTYASWSVDEYLAEGSQSFFNVNAFRSKYDRKHNHIHTRDALKLYDPRLFKIIQSIFPCSTEFVPKCKMSAKDVLAAISAVPLDCDPNHPVPVCQDSHPKCRSWAKYGECDKNPVFMQTKCRTSCNNCKPRSELGCTDGSDHCELWALEGECNINPGFMLVNCSLSCDYCADRKKSPPNPNCKDLNDYCEGWEILGECEKNTKFMNKMCPKSCHQCSYREPLNVA